MKSRLGLALSCAILAAIALWYSLRLSGVAPRDFAPPPIDLTPTSSRPSSESGPIQRSVDTRPTSSTPALVTESRPLAVQANSLPAIGRVTDPEDIKAFHDEIDYFDRIHSHEAGVSKVSSPTPDQLMAEFCRNHNIDATKLSDDQRSKLKASTSDDFDARRMEDRELAVSKRRTLRAAVANGQFVIVSADTIIEAGKDPEFSRLMMQEGQGKSPNLHRDYLMARSRLLMATYGGIDNWMPYQISNGPRHYFAHIFRGQQGDEFFPARDAMNKARLARAEALLRIVK